MEGVGRCLVAVGRAGDIHLYENCSSEPIKQMYFSDSSLGHQGLMRLWGYLVHRPTFLLFELCLIRLRANKLTSFEPTKAFIIHELATCNGCWFKMLSIAFGDLSGSVQIAREIHKTWISQDVRWWRRRVVLVMSPYRYFACLREKNTNRVKCCW